MYSIQFAYNPLHIENAVLLHSVQLKINLSYLFISPSLLHIPLNELWSLDTVFGAQSSRH